MLALPNSAMNIQDYFKLYQALPLWDPRRTERTEDILPKILECVDGDILEIGAHRGGTTKVFCDVGSQYNRRVFVIDPWDGRENGDAGIYQEFCKNTSMYDNLVVHKIGSEHPNAFKIIDNENVNFAFILIDGLHSYDAISNDIKYCEKHLSPHGILCIDDWSGPYTFSKAIRQSTYDHLDDKYVELISPNSLIEKYFVKLW